MELGFYTFADVMSTPQTGEVVSPAQRLRNLLEEIELADQVGLDVFGVGEHHRIEYAVSVSTRGALVVGSPEEVIEKILFQHTIFGHQRFLMQSSIGAMPHQKVLHAIELFGTNVAPVVRRETTPAPTPTQREVDIHS